MQTLLEFVNFWVGGLDDCEKFLRMKNIDYLPLQYESLFTKDTLRSVEAFLSLEVPYNVQDFGNEKLNEIERYQLIENIEEIREKFISMGFPDVYQEL